MTKAIDWDALATAATLARASAYAPYSGFAVGSAVLTDDGRIVTGANVENAVYGLGICAERVAIAAAVAAGARRVRAIAVCALVFATNHLHMSALFAAVALLPGLAWGWLFDKKRNLAGVVLSHAVVGTWVFFFLGVNVG